MRSPSFVFALAASAAIAQPTPLKSSPGKALPPNPTVLEEARFITGLMTVERSYDSRVCKPPSQWKLLRPRVVGKRVDDKDPIAQVEMEMIEWVGTWVGLLLQSGDAAGRHEATEPWYQAPVCIAVFDDVEPSGEAAPNALATDDRNILMGWRMYQRVTQGGFHENRTAGLVYVLAHEFAHYLQFRSKLTFSDPTAMVRELQADCLAGYVMAFTPVRPNDRPGFIQRTFELAAAIGDEGVRHPGHHGKPEQRVVALRAGYEAGGRAVKAQLAASPGRRTYLRSAEAFGACAAFPADQQRPRKAP